MSQFNDGTNPGPKEAFLWWGGGGLSENFCHQKLKKKTHWLKLPKAVRQKTKLGVKYK